MVKFQQRSELAPKGINYEAPAKAKRNPREGISGDRRSQRRYKRAPNGIISEVPAGKFQQRSELSPVGINSESPAKAKNFDFFVSLWYMEFPKKGEE